MVDQKWLSVVIGVAAWLIALAVELLGGPRWLGVGALIGGFAFALVGLVMLVTVAVRGKSRARTRKRIGKSYAEGREILAQIREGRPLNTEQFDRWTYSTRDEVKASLGEADAALLGSLDGLPVAEIERRLMVSTNDPLRRRWEEMALVWLARLDSFIRRLEK